MLCSVDEVIEALGGTTAAASVAGVSAPAVSNWRERSAIPPEYFLRIRDALEAGGKAISPSVFSFKPVEEVRA